jgi:hypothetical protein
MLGRICTDFFQKPGALWTHSCVGVIQKSCPKLGVLVHFTQVQFLDATHRLQLTAPFTPSSQAQKSVFQTYH